MYHIKNDKRAVHSAECIKDAIIKQLKSKPITEIGVSEIAQESKVSRSTFYRLFDTPTDVLKYICDTLIEEIHENYSTSHATDKRGFVLNTLRFWMSHSDILEAILRSGRSDILQNSMEKMTEEDTHVNFLSNLNETETKYIRAYHAAALCSILFVWASLGKKETAEELYEIYLKIYESTIA